MGYICILWLYTCIDTQKSMNMIPLSNTQEVKMYLQNKWTILICFQGSPWFHHEPRGAATRKTASTNGEAGQRHGWNRCTFSKIQVSQICWLLQGVPYFSSFLNGNASTQRVFPGAEPTNTLENSQAVLTCARSLQEQLDNQVSGRSWGGCWLSADGDCLFSLSLLLLKMIIKLYSCQCRCCYHDE